MFGEYVKIYWESGYQKNSETRVPRATVCPVSVFAPAKNVKGTFLFFGQSEL